MPKRQLDLFIPLKAPSPRLKRVEKEIKQILSEIFQRQDIPPIWDEKGQLIPFPGIITITYVKISSDLQECSVFIMPLANRVVGNIESYFEKAAPLIRKSFAQKSVLRLIPHFKFQLDSSFSTAERIEKLLNSHKASLHEESEIINTLQGEDHG